MTLTKKLLAISLLLAATLLVAGRANADAVDFSAVASSPVSDPGTTVGWSYSITNNTAANLEVVEFDVGNFQDTSGTIDTSLFDFPVIAPFSNVSESYDPINFTGLAQFTWSPDAPLGTIESGLFSITLEVLDANGNDTGTSFGVVTTPFSIATTSGTAPVPEPSAGLLLASGLLCLVLIQRKA
jgi:hypothetical protein